MVFVFTLSNFWVLQGLPRHLRPFWDCYFSQWKTPSNIEQFNDSEAGYIWWRTLGVDRKVIWTSSKDRVCHETNSNDAKLMVFRAWLSKCSVFYVGEHCAMEHCLGTIAKVRRSPVKRTKFVWEGGGFRKNRTSGFKGIPTTVRKTEVRTTPVRMPTVRTRQQCEWDKSAKVKCAKARSANATLGCVYTYPDIRMSELRIGLSSTRKRLKCTLSGAIRYAIRSCSKTISKVDHPDVPVLFGHV